MFGKQAQGIICGIAAAVCYGMNPLGATALYAGGLTPDSALFYRYAFAALLLGAWVAARGESFRLTRREAAALALLGALFALSSLTFFASFRVMDTGLACTLLFIYPVMVAAIMAACFGERLTWATAAALALGLGGIGLLCRGGDGGATGAGVALVMASSLAYALYIVALNRARLACSAEKLTFYVLLFCLPFVLLHEALAGHPLPQPLTTLPLLLWALMLAVVPTLLSLVLMARAVRLVGSTPTAILGALEPLTAVALGVTFLGETLTPRLCAGILLILGAVALITLAKPRPA